LPPCPGGFGTQTPSAYAEFREDDFAFAPRDTADGKDHLREVYAQCARRRIGRRLDRFGSLGLRLPSKAGAFSAVMSARVSETGEGERIGRNFRVWPQGHLRSLLVIRGLRHSPWRRPSGACGWAFAGGGRKRCGLICSDTVIPGHVWGHQKGSGITIEGA